MSTPTPTPTLDRTAREAIVSACEDVQDATEGDRIDTVTPGLVARPTDVAQVAEVLRAATAHRLVVVPRGRGTKLSWGTPPTRADVLLDVSALDQVIDHAAGDLIVAAQAGTPLAEVQRAVGSAGQRLALDETVPGTSIGGMLAANTSGPRRVGIGSARDLLIGITVVRADGVVAKAGGRVVKNVAGYDLGKLHDRLPGDAGRHRRRHLPSAPVAGRADLGERRRRPARARRSAWSSRCCTRRASRRPSRSSGSGTGHPAGVVSVLLEGRDDGVAGRAATVRALLGEARDRVGHRRAGRWRDVPLGRHGHRRRPCGGIQAHLRPVGVGRGAAARLRDRRDACVARPGPGWPTPRWRPAPPSDVARRRPRPAAPRLHRARRQRRGGRRTGRREVRPSTCGGRCPPWT